MEHIPEPVLWTSAGLCCIVFLLSIQQLYIAPETQSKHILAQRVSIALVIFLESCLPTTELVVRFVLEVDPIIDMVPPVIFWMLLFVLSVSVYQSIRAPDKIQKQYCVIIVRYNWIIVSVLNFLAEVGCIVLYILFPDRAIFYVNIYFIVFNGYVICAAGNAIILAYHINMAINLSLTIRNLPMVDIGDDHDNESNGNPINKTKETTNGRAGSNRHSNRDSNRHSSANKKVSSSPSKKTKNGKKEIMARASTIKTQKTLSKLKLSKKYVFVSCLIALTLMLLSVFTIYSLYTTLNTKEPFNKLETFISHVAFTLIFSITLISRHWYIPRKSKCRSLCRRCHCPTLFRQRVGPKLASKGTDNTAENVGRESNTSTRDDNKKKKGRTLSAQIRAADARDAMKRHKSPARLPMPLHDSASGPSTASTASSGSSGSNGSAASGSGSGSAGVSTVSSAASSALPPTMSALKYPAPMSPVSSYNSFKSTDPHSPYGNRFSLKLTVGYSSNNRNKASKLSHLGLVMDFESSTQTPIGTFSFLL